jgi:RNA polymerase sigma-70 factor, ECF subfamily
MSLIISGAGLPPFGRLGYLQIGHSRGTMTRRGNIPQCLVSKFSEAFRGVGIRRHRTNERLGSCFRAGGAREVAGVSDLARVLTWPEDEAEVITELRSGSEAAFDWLVTYYHAPVYAVVVGILRNPNDAADVTQEVFLKAFRGIGSFRHGSSLKTWLYRIAVRESLNYRRWFWRHLRFQSSIEDEPLGSCLGLEDPGISPFEELASREIQLAVQHALGEVPPVFRAAVILRDLEGLSYEEVAEVLDVSVGTVKSRILRGRRLLREILEPVLVPRKSVANAGFLAVSRAKYGD